ncbi:peptidase S8 and S53 subtilisin kexin sedolisin, partial [mine drainage metagenome]
MAWDPALQSELLFGGSNLSSPVAADGSPDLNDTWVFANGSWSELFPTVSPPPTDMASMAYDPQLGAMVMFGGQIPGVQGIVPVNTTWAFSGTTWTNVSTVVGPSPRISASMAAAPGGAGLILFGGMQNYPYQEVFENDTWSFANMSWANITGQVGPSPPARMLAGFTDDPSVGGDLLFGGWGDLGGTVTFNDTWMYNSSGWANISTNAEPEPEGGAALAYLSETHSALLFGGGNPASGVDYNQTWSYSGGKWARLSPTSSPPGTFTGTLADDPSSNYAVLLLGQHTTGAPASEQTWQYQDGDWSIAG